MAASNKKRDKPAEPIVTNGSGFWKDWNLSILSRMTGVQVNDCHMRLTQAGLTIEDGPEKCVAAVVAKIRGGGGKKSLHPSGLTWKEWNEKQQGEIKERENRIADLLERREYLLKKDVQRFFAIGLAQLDLIPTKLQSELGLSGEMAERVRQLIDDARIEWSRIAEGIAQNEEPTSNT